MSDTITIGVDHGYAAMKTTHCAFPTGLVGYDNEPYTQRDFLLGQHGGVALGKQGHLRNGDGVGDALIAEGYRLSVPEQVVSELFGPLPAACCPPSRKAAWTPAPCPPSSWAAGRRC